MIKILIITLVAVIIFSIVYKCDFEKTIDAALVEYGWTGKDDPVRGFKMQHILLMPNRYNASLITMLEDENIPLINKKLAVYICRSQSTASFLKVLHTLIESNEDVTLIEEAIYSRGINISEDLKNKDFKKYIQELDSTNKLTKEILNFIEE